MGKNSGHIKRNYNLKTSIRYSKEATRICGA
jgi:hypothetical protein